MALILCYILCTIRTHVLLASAAARQLRCFTALDPCSHYRYVSPISPVLLRCLTQVQAPGMDMFLPVASVSGIVYHPPPSPPPPAPPTVVVSTVPGADGSSSNDLRDGPTIEDAAPIVILWRAVLIYSE